MRKQLVWIAVGGICLGIASFGMAAATQGGDLLDALQNIGSDDPPCDLQKGDTAAASERRLNWDGSDEVTVALAASVHYRGGEGEELVVRGDPALLQHVTLRNGRISLNCRMRGRDHDLDVVLPGRNFRKVSLAGSGKIVMENVKQDDLALRIAGSGSLRAQGQADHMEVSIAGSGKADVTDFTAKTFDVKVAGSGSLHAQGTADSADISIAGSGDADLGDLAIKKLTIKVAGSGDTRAAPTDEADIKIMGSGKVRLLTNPARISTQVMGSGRLIQEAPQNKS